MSKDDIDIFNPNQNPPKVLTGADIIKTMKIVKENSQIQPLILKELCPKCNGELYRDIEHYSVRCVNCEFEDYQFFEDMFSGEAKSKYHSRYPLAKKEEKPKKWWKPEVGAFKTEISYGAERVRSWLVSLKWRF